MGEKPENMSNARWRGYVSAKLERLPIIEKKVDGMMLKVYGISGIVAVLVSIVLSLMKGE